MKLKGGTPPKQKGEIQMKVIQVSESKVFSAVDFVRKASTYDEVLEHYNSDNYGTGYYDSDKFAIVEIVLLSEKEYLDFIDDLLMDREFLAGKGGYTADGKRLCVFVGMEAEDGFIQDGILVDPQGYDYARYTAIPENEVFELVTDYLKKKNVV